jgi:hypothetical protein
VAGAVGVADAAGTVIAGDAAGTGVGFGVAAGVAVGIGVGVGVWPGARVRVGVGNGVGVGATVGFVDTTTMAGPPALTPPGAGGSVASAVAHDAAARTNAAAPATEAIVLRLITDLPPVEKPVATFPRALEPAIGRSSGECTSRPPHPSLRGVRSTVAWPSRRCSTRPNMIRAGVPV